ncbi:MAG: DUF3108 domain-containing protein [Gemmatimonadota bacterium]
MSRVFRGLIRHFLGVALLWPAMSHAQSGERLPVPFGVGERLEYNVKWSRIGVGTASMEVKEVQDVRGRETWHTVFEVNGGLAWYRVNDLYESWFDTRTGNSLRFRKHQRQQERKGDEIYSMFPERGVYIEDGDTAKASVKEPLDEGSFLYFIRTIPLVVGQTYSFDRFYKADQNPVTIVVVRKDTIDVPAGRFPAVVLRPTIKAKGGVFAEDGHAEVWISDDKNRIMLQLKAGLSVGSINLYLKSYRPAPAGTPAQTPP